MHVFIFSRHNVKLCTNKPINRCISSVCVFCTRRVKQWLKMDGKKTMKDYKNHQKSHTGKCDVPSHLWCCAFGLFAFTNTFAFFHSQKTVHSNDVHSKLVQTWSTSLSSENILNSDSAGNTIPLIIYIQLLSITYAYKLDHWLSNRSYGIFKVSAGSQQVTLVRERYRQDAASGSLLPLNTFHFSLV